MLHFGPVAIRTDIFVLIISVLFFAVQMLFCFKVRKLRVRLLPTLPPLILTVTFILLIFFFEGWDALGFLVLALCTAYPLLACGIAWAIWAIHKRYKSKKHL